MLTLTAAQGTFTTIKADVIAIFVAEDQKTFSRQIRGLEEKLKSIAAPLRSNIFSGKDQQTLVLHPTELRNRIVLLVGVGKKEGVTAERLRRASAVAAKTARSLKKKTLALMEPHADLLTDNPLNEDWATIGTSLAEGAALGLYKFDKYITDTSKKNSSLKHIIVAGTGNRSAKEIRKGVDFARVVCEATYFARDLENAPGNEVYPDSLARRVVVAGRKRRFKVKVFNEQKIKQLGMGGLLAVAQGSEKPPRFIIMEHNAGKRRLPTVVLVGKGVTFDSGGISIKPASGMAEMKMDMSGAAAVIGAMQAAAQLKLPVHLVGLVPATENLLGGAAMKPGDILTHFNGKTSEVDNTDAEGRLILADALSFASKYKPDLVIDLATLT
ncbi:MAG: hypothetical protein HY708_00345, partial [Ignavibacteriae bacterium]|nr:hypothetical protein [Ignavibacteriota bacterium]